MAGVARFRAVMLTSLTTFLGLLPMLSVKSTTAQFLIPMAISVAFGLLAITFILLILLPALLVLLNRWRYNLTRAISGTTPEYHEVEPAYKQLQFDLDEGLVEEEEMADG